MPKRLAFDYDAVRELLVECATHYENISPVVYSWADWLYICLQENPANVTVKDLITINLLMDDNGNWINGNYAQNIVYKSMDALNRDTTGMLDF